jgi:hypothetical protein
MRSPKFNGTSHFIARFNQAAVLYRRIGLLSLIATTSLAIRKRLRSRINFSKFSRKYDQHIIYIAGLGNSGSTWMANLCASLPGFELYSPANWHQTFQIGEINEHQLYQNSFNEFSGKLTVVKSHSYGNFENTDFLKASNLKHLITVRDPRDVIISQYWYIRRTHHHIDHQLAAKQSLPEYITQKLESGSFEKTTLSWIRGWLQNRDQQRSIIIRYEDMLDDTDTHWKLALNFLGIKVDEKTIKEIIEMHSFEKKTGRKSGQADTLSTQRIGITGEWKSVFSDEHKHLFSQCGEDVIKSLGYEPTF